MELLNISKPKAASLIKQLVKFNLLKKEQTGNMKPNRLYIQPFNIRQYDVEEQCFVTKDINKTIDIPTYDIVKTFSKQLGSNLYLHPKEFWETMESQNWLDNKNKKIKNWRGLFCSFNERKKINGSPRINSNSEIPSTMPQYKEYKNKMSYQEFLDEFYPIDVNRVNKIANSSNKQL